MTMEDKSEIRTIITKKLDDSVTDILCGQQSRLDIKDGGIDPVLDFNLNERVRELTDAMMEILECQASTSEKESEEKEMAKIVVLKTIGEYTLIERYNDNGNFIEYVVAYHYDDDDKVWASGTYFTPRHPVNEIDKLENYSRALDYLLYKAEVTPCYKGKLEEKLDKMTISYDRLVELATRFKDGVIDAFDDDDSSREFFDELDLTESEREFFGLEDKYDVYEVEVCQNLSRKMKIAVKSGAGEDEAIRIANEIFEDLDLNTDADIQWSSSDDYAKSIGTFTNNNIIDVENDIDCL